VSEGLLAITCYSFILELRLSTISLIACGGEGEGATANTER
jgi:hypothetical protein